MSKPKPPPKPDVAAMAAKLRQRACEKLRLDASKLSPADEIRADRFGVNWLHITDAQAAKVRGEAIDLDAFNVASRTVEDELRAAVENGGRSTLTEARKKLAELLDVSLDDDESPELAAERETRRRQHLEAECGVPELRQKIAELESELAALRGGVALSWSPQPEQQRQSTPAPANVVPLRQTLEAEHVHGAPTSRRPGHGSRE
jgi:hypothetical protein